jgi:hypothetical protein
MAIFNFSTMDGEIDQSWFAIAMRANATGFKENSDEWLFTGFYPVKSAS